MELIFKGVSLGKVNINVLTKYLLKKISLVTIDAQRGVDHMQHRYMVFMLDEIKMLLKANVAMDICDLVVSLNKVCVRNKASQSRMNVHSNERNSNCLSLIFSIFRDFPTTIIPCSCCSSALI